MSILTVIRHGQASFGADDYDHLSELGERQSRALARHWLATGFSCQRVFVGPLRRHRQTWEAVVDELGAGAGRLPEPQYLPELDEHKGEFVFRDALPQLIADNPELARTIAEGAAPREYQRRYMKLFTRFAQGWAEGRHVDPEHESWQAFRDRIGRVIRRMLGDARPDDQVVVFASGGTVAAVTGEALGLGDVKTMELNYMVKNASFSEYLYSPRRFALSTFNAVPHLAGDRALISYV
ncbi:MAG TPA: histidine phosphatase family protein [Gammaproteobacteria bacterium]|nr:histidine phosphatase family protein [Gammaproteobacteria bacterium]